MNSMKKFTKPNLPDYNRFVWGAILGSLLGITLMGVRISSAFSLSEPLQLITSGWEPDSLFAVWKAANDHAVYSSRFDIPYSWAVMNWLFYESYGWFTGWVLNTFKLSDAWLPTVARFWTLFGLLVGWGAAIVAYSSIANPQSLSAKKIHWAYASLVMFGPLIGFWGFTVRPDIWAFTLEIIALLLFWSLFDRRPLLAAAACALTAYAAWSFKQVNVITLGGVGLFLLWRREWKTLFVLCGVSVAGWGLTLWFATPGFLQNAFFTDYEIVLSPARSLKSWGKFAIKSLPTVIPLMLMMKYWPIIKQEENEDPALQLSLCGVIAGVLVMLPLSFQAGGSESYFFTFSFFLALFLLRLLSRLEAQTNPVNLWRAATAGWLAHSAAILLVFFGFQGVLSMTPQHTILSTDKACLDLLPRPLFVQNPYLSLPWMNTGSQPLILNWDYDIKRQAGAKFERNGVGGLIEEGHFASLALLNQNSHHFDHADLREYLRQPQSCGLYGVFLRRNNDLPPVADPNVVSVQ